MARRTASPWSSALVTGASSGIGEALVRRLAEDGVPTVAVARRRDRLEALAERWPQVEVLTADLHDPADRARVVDRLSAPGAPIDLVVNNAGYGMSGPFAEVSLEDQLGQIDLNVTALVALTHGAVAAMRPRRRGWILNVSSVAGFLPSPNAATYAATKAFVTSFSESLAGELGGDGIVLTALCPGLTRSEFHARAAGATGRAGLGARAPRLAWMEADDVARIGLEATAKGRVLVVPGAVNRALWGASSLVPRPLRRRLSTTVRARR